MPLDGPNGNLTVTFSESIYADSSGTAFTDSTIGTIITLKQNNASGTDIANTATISGNTITVNPTSSFTSGDIIHLGISDGWYFGSGGTKTQGTARHIRTAYNAGGSYGNLWLTASGEGALNSATLTNTPRPVIHAATNPGRYYSYYRTGTQNFYAACSGTLYTDATIAPTVTLRNGSATGTILPTLAALTTEDSGDAGVNYLTVTPAADLPAGTYHLRFAPAFVNGRSICAGAIAATATFTIAAATPTKTVSVSAVSTDDYINDAEDESDITISGTSTGLTTGTTITVGVDGSGTDVSGLTDTTISDGTWSVSLTSDQIKALDATTPDADGETLTITATAPDATSGTRTVTYDPTAPTLSAAASGTTLTITASEDVYAATAPDIGDFAITGKTLSNLTGLPTTAATADNSFTITLDSALTGSPTLAYTQNTTDGKRIKDEAGNPTATAASISITGVSGGAADATLSGAPTGTNNTTTLNVTVAGTGVTHYKYDVLAGSSCASATWSASTAVATAITESITTIADGSVILCVAGSTDNSTFDTASPTTASWTKDATAPTISSVSAPIGSTITVTMSENVYAATAPAATDFKVKSGASGSETENVVTAIAGIPTASASADNSFTLTITTALTAGNAVKVYYTKGTNAVSDPAGNDLATLSETNAVTATVPAEPEPTVSFTPPDGGEPFNASDNITVAFGAAIYADSAGTAFTNTTIDDIITFTSNNEDGNPVGFDATISGNTITVNPTANLTSGSRYALALSNGWYFGSGGTKTQGSAKQSFVTYGVGVSGNGYVVFSGAGIDSLTNGLRDANADLHIFHSAGGWHSNSGCTTGYTSTSTDTNYIGSAITLKQTDSTGTDIPFTATIYANTFGYGYGQNYITINPTSALSGTVYLKIDPTARTVGYTCGTTDKTQTVTFRCGHHKPDHKQHRLLLRGSRHQHPLKHHRRRRNLHHHHLLRETARDRLRHHRAPAYRLPRRLNGHGDGVRHHRVRRHPRLGRL